MSEPFKFYFEKVFEPEYIEDLPHNDKLYRDGKANEADFTRIVHIMRTHLTLPIPEVNSLMALFWDLVGNRITPSVISPIDTFGFWCEIHKGQKVGMICVPQDWHGRLKANPHMQMGAMVFAASQAKDYWNNKFSQFEYKRIKMRALSFEAHLLKWFQAHAPGFIPNDYQQNVMKEFPDGLQTKVDGSLIHYAGRPYDGKGPPYPFDMTRLDRRK